MRGLLTFLTLETGVTRYRTGVLVLSADPDIARRALARTQASFPRIQWAYVAPRLYKTMLPSVAEVYWIDDAKRAPADFLSKLRRRKFDLCIVLHPGRRSFRNAKIAAWLVNARRFVIYDEQGEFVLADRSRWKTLFYHFSSRAAQSLNMVFFPFGFLYLIARTFWLKRRTSCTSGNAGAI